MSTPAVSLVWPFPPWQLATNRQSGHSYHAIKKISDGYKELCYISTRDAKQRLLADGYTLPLTPPVEMHIMFVVRNWHRRDWDGLIPGIKKAQDTLVDMELIQDDSISFLRPVVIDFSTGPQPKVWIHLYADKATT